MDIEEFEFSDEHSYLDSYDDDYLLFRAAVHFYELEPEAYVNIEKEDAIAIAKHFKITEEDLAT